MKRSPLKRKKPLQRKMPMRGALPSMLKALPKRQSYGVGGPRLCKRAIRRRRREKATPEEKAHLNRVARLGCLIDGCRQAPSIHHIRTGYGAGQRASHWETLPLCKDHHQDGGMGVAFHAGPRTWQAKYGTEVHLLTVVYARLEIPFDCLPGLRGEEPPWWPRYLDGSALSTNAAVVFEEEVP